VIDRKIKIENRGIMGLLNFRRGERGGGDREEREVNGYKQVGKCGKWAAFS
jgi:hypothetical protein